jgi:hypothetical protein
MHSLCQKLTCTFVPVAIHKLQRVQSDSTERTREFPTGQATDRVAIPRPAIGLFGRGIR